MADAAGLERQLAPVAELLLDTAQLQPGERVLDVGCGTGVTTRQAAGVVSPTGSVTGLDVAAEMLDAARQRDSPGSAIEWVQADATSWDGPSGGYDVVLSRFGVMFFDDPPRAFANLARMTRPGGRLVVAVWNLRTHSPLFEVPLAAAVRALRQRGVQPRVPRVDEGPFSLGDEARAVQLLAAAGWAGVERVVHEVAMPFQGGVPPEEAGPAAMRHGPVSALVDGCDDTERAAVAAAVTATLADHREPDGPVVLTGSVVLLTATRR